MAKSLKDILNDLRQIQIEAMKASSALANIGSYSQRPPTEAEKQAIGSLLEKQARSRQARFEMRKQIEDMYLGLLGDINAVRKQFGERAARMMYYDPSLRERFLGLSGSPISEQLKALQDDEEFKRLIDSVNRRAKSRGKAEIPPYSREALEGLLGVTTATDVLTKAAELGFSVEHIKRVKIFNDNYKQVLFSMQVGNRTFKEAQLVVDKYGNILTSTQKQFRTFADAIRRNIVEMVKWSAATLVVWGSIRKVSELINIAIDNETQLASIGVVLGKSQKDLADVFDAAAEAAYKTGESLTGVLEGYAQAYRATGNITDQTERAAVAQDLLINSLILSRLSSLNQSQAMDTLIGALRQAGLQLNEGSKLLDSWVRVSRYASVSIDTLAESFAIVAGAAESAGVDMHKLNGIIAVLAESTTLSATEAGNAVRAFISGFSSDQAVKEMTKFGIAVTDTKDQTRGFLEILDEISSLYRAGIISDDQLREIARAIGGQGARREAQIVTVIKNLSRANEVAAISAEANGDAMQALSIQLEVVQTSINRLSNAFQILARTMGAEGGTLGVVQLFLTILEKLVLTTSFLIKNLGELTPALAGVAAILFLSSQNTRIGFLANLSNIFARMRGGSIYAREYLGLTYGEELLGIGRARGSLAERITAGLLAPGLFGKGTVGGQLGAAAFLGYSLFQDIENQDWEGIGGSIAGAIAGFLIGGPIGSIIGTTIGETFANVIFDYEPKFENLFKEIFREAPKEAKIVPTEKVPTPTEITEDIFRTYGREVGFPVGEAGGKIAARLSAFVANLIYGGARTFGFLGRGAPEASITPELFALGKIRSEEERRRLFGLIYSSKAEKSFGVLQPISFIAQEQNKLAQEYSKVLDDIINKEKERYTSAALAGKITDRELRNALDLIPKLSSILTKYEIAFGDAFRSLNSGVKTTEDTFLAFTSLVINSSSEQIQWLNAITQEINDITNSIQTAKKFGQEFVVIREDDPATLEENEQLVLSIAEAQEYLNSKIKEGAILATNMFASYKKGIVTLPSIVTLDIREEELTKVLERASQKQAEFIAKTFEAGLNQGLTIEDIVSTFEPVMIQAGKDGGLHYAEGFMTQFLTSTVEEMRKAGELLPPPAPLGLRVFDIPSTQFPAVMARYQQLLSTIQAQVPEWKPDEETFAALFTDYIAMPITADLTLLNIAMQELIDVNKKQLDGIYNLPTDASFYVPFTGYQLGFVNRGGGGGGGLAEALAAAKEAADTATEKIAEQYARDRVIEKLTREGRPTKSTSIFEIFDYGKRVMREYQETQYPPYTSPGSRTRIKEFPPPIQVQSPFQGTQSFTDVIRSIGEIVGNSLKNLSATLNLQIETKTQIILDGRQLAEAIKPYFTEDEIRFEGTGGGAVKRFII